MWEYLTVFVLAATPLVELLVVIPIGIGYGLAPAAVALVTVLGNALPVLGIVVAYERLRLWRERRSARRAAAEEGEGESGAPPSARWQRAQRLWVRYGTPGLALLAPLVTGVHFAALAALALGTPRRSVAVWMVVSIVLWSVGVTLVTVAGIQGWRHLAS